MMFSQFSEKLYRSCVSREYRLPHQAAEDLSIASAREWMVWKVENAGLCFVRVIDCDQADVTQINSRYASMMTGSSNSLSDYRQVLWLYILVTQSAAPARADNEAALAALLENAAAYWGQEVYAVFWRVRLDTRVISVPEGQPADINGIRALVSKALAEPDAHSARQSPSLQALLADIPSAILAQQVPTFGEIKNQAVKDSPFQPVLRFTAVTYALLAINALVLLCLYGYGYPADPLVPLRFGAILPELVLVRREYYRLFTAMFVHFGLAHFAMNAVGLLIFGCRVERYFGRIRFLLIYVLSGLSGSVFSLLFTQGYAAGASGAIYGLLGAVLAFARISKMTIDRLDAYILCIFIGTGLAMGLAMPNIDNFGHIGGLLMGLVVGGMLVSGMKRRRRHGA